MRILPFQPSYPNLQLLPDDAPADDFFDKVKTDYAEHAKAGKFQQHDREGIFIYQIKNEERTYTGIVACTDIAEYLRGNIKKHENTIVSNEDLQVNLMRERAAAIKPVLLTYQSVPEIHQLLHEYIASHKKFYKVRLADGRHRFWKITKPEVAERLQTLFAENVPSAYIADGHHRTASAAKLYEAQPNADTERLLCAFFPSDQLKINEFNRTFEGLNGLSEKDFLAKITEVAEVEKLGIPQKPDRKLKVTMFLNGQWYMLRWKNQTVDHFAEGKILLDVHLLNEKILKGVLGVKNVRTDARLKYVEGTKGLEGLQKACSATDTVGFYLYPVDYQDFVAVSDSNGIMPPKSTFFEPRMKNGLLVYDLNVG